MEPFSLLSTRGFDGSDILSSDDILCQHGDGLLEFNYWITSGAIVRVCAVRADNGTEIFCSETLNSLPAPGEAYINIPGPIRSPFKVRKERFSSIGFILPTCIVAFMQ